MSAITVRNLDERTRDRLKALAARHGRAVGSEARVILRAAVTPTAGTRRVSAAASPRCSRQRHRRAVLGRAVAWHRAVGRTGTGCSARAVIVLNTNPVSELMWPASADRVVAWVDRHPAGELWCTATGAAELLGGVSALPDGARKRRLGAKVGIPLADRFADRILPLDQHAAVARADVLAAAPGRDLDRDRRRRDPGDVARRRRRPPRDPEHGRLHASGAPVHDPWGEPRP